LSRPSLALRGSSVMPSADLILVLDTTYDSVSFFKRSELRGSGSTSPILTSPATKPLGIDHSNGFLSKVAEISETSSLVESDSSSAKLYTPEGKSGSINIALIRKLRLSMLRKER